MAISVVLCSVVALSPASQIYSPSLPLKLLTTLLFPLLNSSLIWVTTYLLWKILLLDGLSLSFKSCTRIWLLHYTVSAITPSMTISSMLIYGKQMCYRFLHRLRVQTADLEAPLTYIVEYMTLFGALMFQTH